MRNRLDIYDQSGQEMSYAFCWVFGISVVMALICVIMGTVGLFDPISPEGMEWTFLGILPLIVNGMGYANHISHGLPTTTHQKLVGNYYRMPRKTRKEMPLTREDILSLSANEASVLNEKIVETRAAYNKMRNTNIINAHDWMDAVIQTHEEMELR